MSNPVQKGFSGWLIKRGGFNKGWKKRWFSYKQPRMTRTSEGMFAVRKAFIQYFVSPENTKPKGKIIMEDIIDVTPATNFHNVEDLMLHHIVELLLVEQLINLHLILLPPSVRIILAQNLLMI